MERFGLIQLSDLQFGSSHRFGNPSEIVDSLARDINFLAEKHKFIPVYLLLTGDVTETSHAQEFKDAALSIKTLSQLIAVDKDSILSVPGNHDINWALSKTATIVGDPDLKYDQYNKFVKQVCNDCSIVENSEYKKHFDDSLGLEFLLINSCEKEDHETHLGFVNKEKLIKSIHKESKENYTRIALIHHRIELCGDNRAINNSEQIRSILLENNYKIILSGHIHQNICYEHKEDSSTIIHSGSGSAGVKNSQRDDGIQNQYTVHVLDAFNKRLESHWRAYSPQKKTQFGLGGWVNDNAVDVNPSTFSLPDILTFDNVSTSSIKDQKLIDKYKIRSNPFTFNNAEKISVAQIIDLFVSSEGRNKGAVRLTGDAIIRGTRGSGKTMLLRYLEVFGNIKFNENFSQKKGSESFPVMVNLSMIHSSEKGAGTETVIDSAERLIYDSVLTALDRKCVEFHSPEFKEAFFRMKQKLAILNNQEGSLVWKLGLAIKENMSKYFQHVLLLIDEVAPVFPREFFNDKDGFLKWMNEIRNSGPYLTRVAVYPSDVSDILNEERFGTIVNLDYDIKNTDEYVAFRKYCIELVNKYLNIVSIDRKDPTKITDIINILDNDPNDPLEQLIYASDGSSRRFLSLMDKCLTSSMYQENHAYEKEQIFSIIKEFSNNLLASYDLSDKELAQSIAKACKKQITYRFRLPGLSGLILSLHSKREELNIVKLAEAGTGRRGTAYEFTYPYCILMDLQTHYLKDTRKVCVSRDHITGDWISPVTTIEKDQIDFLNKELRLEGEIIDIVDNLIEVKHGEESFLSEVLDAGLSIGDKVTFINLKKGLAADILKI